MNISPIQSVGVFTRSLNRNTNNNVTNNISNNKTAQSVSFGGGYPLFTNGPLKTAELLKHFQEVINIPLKKLGLDSSKIYDSRKILNSLELYNKKGQKINAIVEDREDLTLSVKKYSNGKIKQSIGLDDNGKINSKFLYRDNKRTNGILYLKNGSTQQYSYNKNDELTSITTKKANGKVANITEYNPKTGKIAFFKTITPDGKGLEKINSYKDGKLVERKVYKNGDTLDVTVKFDDDGREVLWTSHHPIDGSVKGLEKYRYNKDGERVVEIDAQYASGKKWIK